MWSDWLAFCDCGFQSVCPLMEKDKMLMEASWWERLTEGETGSCSDWGGGGGREGMLSKLLIQFSVEGRGCVPWLLFDLGPNYGGGDEDNGDLLQKAPCKHCYTQWPSPAAGHRRPTPPPETPEHSQRVWVSLLWDHCSFLLGPGAHEKVQKTAPLSMT